MSEHPRYLSGLDLSGRRVVVVGGGSVAARRIGPLARAGADVVVVALRPTPSVESFPGITVHARRYESGDLDGAWYVVACTDDPDVNAAVVADATAQRTFCVRADDAPRGTAATPATASADGVTVGVLAGGDHRRSAAVRDAVAGVLGGNSPTAVTTPRAPGVALVGGGPGDPELITVRGRRLLAAADVVVADRLAPPELLAELRPDVEIIDAAKVPYGRAMPQEAINDVLIDRARAGKFVVRLKGGDPFVFGRGSEEVLACAAAGVPVTVVPGVSSPFAVPAAAGIPVTHRAVTHEVVVVSGHLPPGHPESLVDWDALARLRGTVVLMMAVARVGEFAAALLTGRDPQTPVAFVENGTLPTQRVVRATLATAAEVAVAEQVRPPAIVVIGDVVDVLGAGAG